MTGLIMKYFVLKPHGRGPYAQASRAAMKRYADAIVDENPELAQELVDWLKREWDWVGEQQTNDAQQEGE